MKLKKSLWIMLVLLTCTFFATQNGFAQDNVQIIKEYKDKTDLKIYDEILQFIGVGENRFGKIHPKAPAETTQFGQLAGVWEVENSAWFQGKWFCCWRAVWAFKYTLGGFGVQDYYMQLTEDLPPTLKLGRNSSLTQLRLFSKMEKRWKITYIVNNAGETGLRDYGEFTANEMEGELIMTPPTVEGQPLNRVVFYEIKKDSFLWRQEFSNDKGKTWEKRTMIKAKRLL